MSLQDEAFKKFNRTNLVNEIYRVVPMDKKTLRREVKECLWPRLDFLHGKRNKAPIYYIFEDSYVETEWKDMISIHYINTSYKVQSTVMRVHLFVKPKLESEFYIGFFTLRKIDEARIMLSFIFPNWSKLYCDAQPVCVMSYKKNVHLMGKELQIYTYPLFVQDNITVSCSHVSMITMTMYLHQKFDYRRIRILDLNKAFSIGKTKLFPTAGLNPTQMIEIFNFYNIPVGHQAIKLGKNDEKEKVSEGKYEKYRQKIDYTIESGIPVILGITIQGDEKGSQRHVVQIIGHTQQNREEYVVYDDSGYFLKKGFEQNGFVAAISWDELKEYILPGDSFIIYPIHEKVYLMYDDFKSIFFHMFEKVPELIKLKAENACELDKTRFLIADNRDIKKFFREFVLPDSLQSELLYNEIVVLLKINMPHYVWYCEVPVDEGYLIFIADPTYGNLTKKYIFFNTIPIYSNNQFGMLNYS